MTDCIFCKIINEEIPSKIIHKDADLIVFYDINPKAPVHVLITPKRHIISLIEIKPQDQDLLGKLILTANIIAKKLGLDKGGFKVVINNGEGSGQLVNHLHLHVLGGWKRSPGWEV